jgi:hypothetical protein
MNIGDKFELVFGDDLDVWTVEIEELLENVPNGVKISLVKRNMPTALPSEWKFINWVEKMVTATNPRYTSQNKKTILLRNDNETHLLPDMVPIEVLEESVFNEDGYKYIIKLKTSYT